MVKINGWSEGRDRGRCGDRKGRGERGGLR